MMSYRINRLCSLDLLDDQLYGQLDTLSEKVVDVANFFGFGELPDEHKIKLHECSELEFENTARHIYNGYMDYSIAFTCNVNQVYVLNYTSLKDRYSLRSYIKIIVHECVHVLYAYYSLLPPAQYAWLYESIACYLAKQKKTYFFNELVPWERFSNNFYEIDDCYALAYNFGRLFFAFFREGILTTLKNPFLYMDKFMYVYNNKLWGL